MTPEEWHRVRPILESALELDSGNRRAFLNEACADPSLRREVESLIDAHEQAETWDLNSLSVLGLGVEEGARFRLLPSRRVGPYEILEELALGGMGAVYRAVRADGEYKQQVALKIVRADFGADSTAKRFRNERQILASLDHHNIAKILDGGTTADGLPYFVMEFIDGLPITDYCDRHKLTIDARLTIFRTVCSAVHHAHQHLVIHRDLKPSNILVLEDGSPKLLDFGIAKVLNPETSNQNWLATQTGLRCMTPAYASPEQARGKSVSRETDVYSLGVVLYELLTGHRPYRLTQNSPAEIERAICEQEPEAPSTVIRRVENDTSPDGKPITKTPELVSLTRGGEPDKLRRRLRGDLDNIVLKSLQKEPKCRYGSVAEFSQDIDRHLQHQTVKARPRTFAYRVSKFVRRHRTEVSAAFAVVLATFAAASFAFNPAGIRNRLGIGSSQAKIRSSAVIPVVNISGDPSQEYASSVQHRPLNLNAWDAYLQGNYYLKKEDAAMGARDEDLRKAGEFFQHAIDADPAFVSAYIGLAEAHHNLWWSSSEDLAIMRAAAAKALELAPTSSDAHLEAAVTKWEEWDWIGAEEESRRAVGLNANNAEAHQTLGYALDSTGQVDEAWKEYEIAQQLAPKPRSFLLGFVTPWSI